MPAERLPADNRGEVVLQERLAHLVHLRGGELPVQPHTTVLFIRFRAAVAHAPRTYVEVVFALYVSGVILPQHHRVPGLQE
eukprot:8762812-Heterocapsa_arctica.AAC.1